MHTSLLTLAPPVQSPSCGARSSVRCYSHGGTWRRAPRWWRWLCRMWSALSSGPFVSDPTGFYTVSTVSLELPAPERHTDSQCILKNTPQQNNSMSLMMPFQPYVHKSHLWLGAHHWTPTTLNLTDVFDILRGYDTSLELCLDPLCTGGGGGKTYSLPAARQCVTLCHWQCWRLLDISRGSQGDLS